MRLITMLVGIILAHGAIAGPLPIPQNSLPILYTGTMPSALGWDVTHFPITASIYDTPGIGRSVGIVNITPEALFNLHSTALSSPGQTYYVSASGSGSSCTSGTPCTQISTAILLCNAGGTPCKVNVAAGLYPRGYGPGGSSGIYPTVDLALVATGGRVLTGTFDQFSAPSKDPTYTNTYSFSLSNADAAMDMANLNAFGNYTPLYYVSNPSIVNVTPCTWNITSGTFYGQRCDGAPITDLNTRIYRTSAYNFYFRAQVSVYVGDGGATPLNNPPSGFDAEGGSVNSGAASVFNYDPITINNSQLNIVVVKNSTFKYGGGIASGESSVDQFSVHSLNGLSACFNCGAGAGYGDAFSTHNEGGASESMFLCVNCTGVDNGRSPNTSVQGLTSHENVKVIDVAGYYSNTHGRAVSSDSTTASSPGVAWLLGTVSRNDFGDITFGGFDYPQGFAVNTAYQYYCERTKVDMPGGIGAAYAPENVNSAIYLRNVWPTGLPSGGPGTLGTW